MFICPLNGNCVEELIAYADKAMYAEKKRMKEVEQIVEDELESAE